METETQAIYKDIDVVTAIERRHRELKTKEDNGSYCESSSREFQLLSAVVGCARELKAALENLVSCQ